MPESDAGSVCTYFTRVPDERVAGDSGLCCSVPLTSFQHRCSLSFITTTVLGFEMSRNGIQRSSIVIQIHRDGVFLATCSHRHLERLQLAFPLPGITSYISAGYKLSIFPVLRLHSVCVCVCVCVYVCACVSVFVCVYVCVFV